MPKITHLLLSLFVVTTIFLAACTPEAAPAPATDLPEPTDVAELEPTAEPDPTPEPEPTAEPEPTPEPTATEDAEGPPPTEADLSLYMEAEERAAYQEIPVDDTAVPAFHEAYLTALANDPASLQDPYTVADLFIDTTRRFSEEPIPYEESFYLPAPADEAIFVFIQGEYKDDSVWGHKIRIELSLQDDGWQLEWAGEQWRCRRGDADLIENWHTTLCP